MDHVAIEQRSALDEFWKVYPGLVRRVTVIVRDPDEAQDIAQTALLRALEGREPELIRDPRAWLYTVATRLALNELRRRKRWAIPGWHRDAGTAMVTDVDLWAALADLDRNERAAVVMQVLEGYSHEEIAQRLGVALGTASSWLSRGKAKLRRKLTDEGEQHGRL